MSNGRNILQLESHEVKWARSWSTLLTITCIAVVLGHKGKSFRGCITSLRWERGRTERCVKKSLDIACNHKGWWWTNKDEWLIPLNVTRWQYKPQKENLELSTYERGTQKWRWWNSTSKKLEEKNTLQIISLKGDITLKHCEHPTQWMTKPCHSHWQTEC